MALASLIDISAAHFAFGVDHHLAGCSLRHHATNCDRNLSGANVLFDTRHLDRYLFADFHLHLAADGVRDFVFHHFAVVFCDRHHLASGRAPKHPTAANLVWALFLALYHPNRIA